MGTHRVDVKEEEEEVETMALRLLSQVLSLMSQRAHSAPRSGSWEARSPAEPAQVRGLARRLWDSGAGVRPQKVTVTRGPRVLG